MKGILNNTRLSLVRLLLLAGVLSAIFFSGGEGIRLLPFADANKNGEFSGEQSADKFNSYVFSLGNSANRRIKPAIDSQSPLKNHSLATGFLTVPSYEANLRNIEANGDNFGESNRVSFNPVLSQPSDRAPPVV